MALAEDDDVIEKLTPDRSDEALDDAGKHWAGEFPTRTARANGRSRLDRLEHRQQLAQGRRIDLQRWS